MSAQIQRTFFGFTLGTTTKSEVYNKCNGSVKITEIRGGYQIWPLSFGGYDWTGANLLFYKNKLYQVLLYSRGYATRDKDEIWNELNAKLKKKYFQYYSSSSTLDDVWYIDNYTYLNLEFIYYNNISECQRRLIYTDRALYTQKKIDEDNEL